MPMVVGMERVEILRNLVTHGTQTNPQRCAQIAADLGLLASDVLTIA